MISPCAHVGSWKSHDGRLSQDLPLAVSCSSEWVCGEVLVTMLHFHFQLKRSIGCATSWVANLWHSRNVMYFFQCMWICVVWARALVIISRHISNSLIVWMVKVWICIWPWTMGPWNSQSGVEGVCACEHHFQAAQYRKSPTKYLNEWSTYRAYIPTCTVERSIHLWMMPREVWHAVWDVGHRGSHQMTVRCTHLCLVSSNCPC